MTTAKLHSREVEEALQEQKRIESRIRSIVITLSILVVLALTVIVLEKAVFPIIVVDGSSMEPGLYSGDITVVNKLRTPSKGDIAAFSYQGKTVVKRLIAFGGDVVDIDSSGNVSVNGELLEEAYVSQKSLEPCEIEFPYVVPEGCFFVLGDNRAASADSRVFGSIEKENILGTFIFRIWPVW